MEQQQDNGGIEISILHISDTHQFHEWHHLPSADILICTGDVTNSGTVGELQQFNRWLGEIKHMYGEIYFISGNHDWWGRNKDDLPQHVWRLWNDYKIQSITDLDDVVREYLQAQITNARVLEHELVTTMCGLKIYGSSWVPWLNPQTPDQGCWHWGARRKAGGGLEWEWPFYAEMWSWLWKNEMKLPRKERKLQGDMGELQRLETEGRRACLPNTFFAYSRWAGHHWEEAQISKEDYLRAFPAPESRYWEIPEDVDILLTHGGSLMGWCGAASNSKLDVTKPAWGSCWCLVQVVEDRKPKAHLYGHHHSGFGVHKVGETLLSNASSPDDRTRSLVNSEGCLLLARTSKCGWCLEASQLQASHDQCKPHRSTVSTQKAHMQKRHEAHTADAGLFADSKQV